MNPAPNGAIAAALIRPDCTLFRETEAGESPRRTPGLCRFASADLSSPALRVDMLEKPCCSGHSRRGGQKKWMWGRKDGRFEISRDSRACRDSHNNRDPHNARGGRDHIHRREECRGRRPGNSGRPADRWRDAPRRFQG